MFNLTQLRIAARELFDHALTAVDAGRAVRQAVQREGPNFWICGQRFEVAERKVYSIAIGKAAKAMAIALDDQLGDSLSSGLIVRPMIGYHQSRELVMTPRKFSTRWQWIEGGHPFPNQSSLEAARGAFDLLDQANQENAFVIFLISGGGSAMIEWPADEDISLADLQAANKVLVGCGASIGEINEVRRTFSSVKGGRLAARAPDCDQITLIVSDVPPGEERNVASGPTMEPAPGKAIPVEIVEKYKLASRLPPTILRVVRNYTKAADSDLRSIRKHFVLLTSSTALEATAQAARTRGFIAEVATEIADEPIEDGCKELLDRLSTTTRQIPSRQSETVCLLSAGEFSCPVRGSGIGGRNLETALRLACLHQASNQPFVALCAGTDGIDGNSPAAGAIVDTTTLQRARAIGLDPREFLERSDAYSFFVALGDVIATGPTGTNVRDLRILLAGTS